MSARLAIVCNPNRLSSKIQALGARLIGKPTHPAMPYHAAWITDDAIYDMDWRFRKRDISAYAGRDLRLFDPPALIPVEHLEAMVGVRRYGVMDVLLYPLFQMIGLNWWGTHCSEAVNDDIWFCGGRTPWIPYGAPPSPTDMLIWLEGRS